MSLAYGLLLLTLLLCLPAVVRLAFVLFLPERQDASVSEATGSLEEQKEAERRLDAYRRWLLDRGWVEHRPGVYSRVGQEEW